MDYRDLTGADEQLTAAAFDVIRRNYRADYHCVGAAVRAGSGKVYAGVHLESSGVDVCAEWTALGAAASAGERRFDCIVAASREELMSPCGLCRELLHYFNPEMDVIVPTPAGPRKVRIAELLPIPYTGPGPEEGR